jgi:hypothetical protein
MKSAYIQYLRNLLYLSAILGFIALIIRFILPKIYFSPAIPFLLFFFISTSLLSFYFLLQASGKKFIKFVNAFLLSIIIKLFLYAVVMISYVLIYRKDAIPFMLGFFILYLCYTVFESASIIKYTQSSNPDNKVRP